TIGLINSNFIPILVDSDLRPDINDRYNLGGWPTTAFLDSKGNLITGGTYLPPDQFKEAVRQIADSLKSDRERIEQAISTRSLERRDNSKTEQSPTVSKAMIELVIDAAIASYDKRHGGFGSEPKFLYPATLSLLLEEGITSGRQELVDAAVDSLRKMRTAGIAEGRRFGIYDHEAGGFFRYSATEDWTIPHFEKMLEENARMLDVYVTAYQITGDELFLETAHGIMNFFDEWMYDEDRGFFYASMSPDGEDRYYSLSASERAQMPHPPVDHTLFVNWNAQMISAHLKAGAVLREPFVLEAAHHALDYLLTNCRAADCGMNHHLDGGKQGEGFLSDQVYMTSALLDAFELSGERKYLDEAQSLICHCKEYFLNEGAFMDRKSDREPLGLLRFELFPL